MLCMEWRSVLGELLSFLTLCMHFHFIAKRQEDVLKADNEHHDPVAA